jgi:hypothetical protein
LGTTRRFIIAAVAAEQVEDVEDEKDRCGSEEERSAVVNAARPRRDLDEGMLMMIAACALYIKTTLFR